MRLNKTQCLEKLFYATIAVYFFLSAMTLTMAVEIAKVDKFATFTRYACYALMVMIIIGNVISFKKDNFLKHFISDCVNYVRTHVMLVITLVTTFMIFLQTKERLPIIMMLLIWTCSFYDFKKIAKLYLYASMMLMLITWVLTIMGVVQDISMWRDDILRHSLGYVYPLETMTHLLFMTICYIFIKGKEFDFKDYIVVNMMGILLYVVTDARTSFYLLVLASTVALICAKIKLEIILKWVFPYFGYLILIFCTILSVGGAIVYDRGYELITKLDVLFSNRFRMMNEAFDKYGFTWFGEKIEWVGYGGLIDPVASTAGKYNFVDCSYGKVLLDYGIVFFVLVLIGYAVIYHTASKEHDYALIIAISVVLVVSVMEPRLVSIEMNPFVLLLGRFFLKSNPTTLRKKEKAA